MSDGEDNRRRARRFTINDEFAELPGDGAVTHVSDLSEHGVFIHTRQRVPVGTTIELRFTVLLDDPMIIQGFGTVVRQGAEGLGVEFGQLSPGMVLRIHDAISRQKARDTLRAQRVEARRADTGDSSFDTAKTGVFPAPNLDEDGVREEE